jgi:hypothetical protein
MTKWHQLWTSSHRTSIRLIPFCGWILGLVAALHLIVFVCYRSAMNTFDNERYNEPEGVSLAQARGDPKQTMLSAYVFENLCDFTVGIHCDQIYETSDAVKDLAKQQLPLETRRLIEKNTYASAYDITEALLSGGHDREALDLLENPVFDASQFAVVERANFANRWYLLPAFEYIAHNREYDGLAFFKSYLTIMRHSVSQGKWLSLPGLDATDLPALADTFCINSDKLSNDECLLSLLRLADSDSEAFAHDPRYGREDRAAVDAAQAYQQLPDYIVIKPLRDYLAIWSWNGYSVPEPGHGSLTPVELAAWNYAYAVRLLEPGSEEPGCTSRVQRSRELLATVAFADSKQSVFTIPASHRLQYISSKGNGLCEEKHDTSPGNK